MALSMKERHIPGIWGPYFSAMVPGFWLNEGGQSTTGAFPDTRDFHDKKYNIFHELHDTQMRMRTIMG